MGGVDVDGVVGKGRAQPLRILAEISREQLLRLQILEGDIFTVRQWMTFVDDELEAFGEQRPGIEPVPFFADFSRNAELGFALLEKFPDFPRAAAQEAKFKPAEQPLDLVEIREQQRQNDGMAEADP